MNSGKEKQNQGRVISNRPLASSMEKVVRSPLLNLGVTASVAEFFQVAVWYDILVCFFCLVLFWVDLLRREIWPRDQMGWWSVMDYSTSIQSAVTSYTEYVHQSVTVHSKELLEYCTSSRLDVKVKFWFWYCAIRSPFVSLLHTILSEPRLL